MKEPKRYEAWLLTLGAYHPALQTYDITEPMPLIRCTVKPPCGHCHYCRAWKESHGNER